MKTKIQNAIARVKNARLVKETEGLTTVEYVIVLVLVVLVAIGVWGLLGTTVSTAVQNANTNLSTPIGG